MRCEAKARRSGSGFATLEKWLSDDHALFLKRNRQDPLILLPWHVWSKLLQIIKIGNQGAQIVVEIKNTQRPQIMVAHAYVGVNEQLVRVGWVEIFRTATGDLIAVPSIPAHTAAEHLHATVDGDVVVVTVKKRGLNG